MRERGILAPPRREGGVKGREGIRKIVNRGHEGRNWDNQAREKAGVHLKAIKDVKKEE